MTARRVGGSFRDPDGFLFVRDDILYRQINIPARDDWDLFRSSGLQQELIAGRLLIAHHEMPIDTALDEAALQIIRPERIPFISYPYEWTPSQLRDAALLTLRVQLAALDRGMILKDASAFNVQFTGNRPIFIDTLSFTRYVAGEPWLAYRQFCQHFLAPLLLMAHVDPRLRELTRSYLDGVPLDLASRLLPRSTWLRPAILAHVHLHGISVQRHGGREVPARVARRGVSLAALRALVEHLAATIRRIRFDRKHTEWSGYEATHNYSAAGQAAKETAVEAYAMAHRPALAFDLGANAGHYSQRLRDAGAYVIAIDSDLGAVEALRTRLDGEAGERILPLWVDLANPGPAQGWAHTERESLVERSPADMVLALALVHHLAIGNNVPLPAIAAHLAQLGRRVVLEWVPKDDPQAQRLLVSREDIFADYTREAFVAACAPWFVTEATVAVPESDRVLFMLARR